MKIKVANLAFSNNKELVNRLQIMFPDSEINNTNTRLTGDELVDFFYDADGVIVGLEKVDEALLKKLPNLKIIAKYGVGLDNIDLDACKNRNIDVGWNGGVNKSAVAEMALGFMISLSRNLYSTSNQLKELIWNKNGGFQISGKTIGIIGCGHIGRELVELLQVFKCKILINDILDLSSISFPSSDIKFVDKEFLFENSDIISIHTPLTDMTKNLFNRDTFIKMKNNSFLINTARGGIVNEIDLEYALKNNLIAGAAIDVYDFEPPQNVGLLSLPNLICTPHIGGNSYEAVIAMGISALSHLNNFIK